MIFMLLLKIVIYGIIFMRSRAVSHDRNEPTNQPILLDVKLDDVIEEEGVWNVEHIMWYASSTH